MTKQAGICEYRKTCHFFNMKNMTPENKRIRDFHCIEWPEKCEIHRARVLNMPVSITLWPTGKIHL